MTMTNFRRAERAAKIFDRYAMGEHADKYDLASMVLVNLLIDLMHFAERQTIDFDLLLRSCAGGLRSAGRREGRRPGRRGVSPCVRRYAAAKRAFGPVLCYAINYGEAVRQNKKNKQQSAQDAEGRGLRLQDQTSRQGWRAAVDAGTARRPVRGRTKAHKSTKVRIAPSGQRFT